MPKPLAAAMVRPVFSGYNADRPERVEIRKSRAAHGRASAQFYAPGWRAMAFVTLDQARAKLERHPGFVAWVEAVA